MEEEKRSSRIVTIGFPVIERYIGDTNHRPPQQDHKGCSSSLKTTPLHISELLQSLD